MSEHVSKVPLDVLALVQDADHVEPVCTLPNIDHVGAGPCLAGSGAHLGLEGGQIEEFGRPGGVAFVESRLEGPDAGLMLFQKRCYKTDLAPVRDRGSVVLRIVSGTRPPNLCFVNVAFDVASLTQAYLGYAAAGDDMVARLFFSYSHKDEALRDQLEVHLAMLKREGLLETWHDRRIIAGSELDPAISAELERADVILFLVSPDFLASNYCYEEEAGRALERHEQKSARVIPVILRPCEWQRAPFGKLLAAPTDGKPITKWPDQDDAFLDVTRAIRCAVGELGKASKQTANPNFTQRLSPSIEDAKRSFPRSSNMRVTKVFTQRDQADFLDETFEFISRFFERSLEELEKRNAGIETRFRRIDADRLTGVIYRSGNQVSACTIFRGGLAGGTTQICYSMNENAATSGFNETVSVASDEQSLFMRAMGMSYMRMGRAGENAKLSPEGVAELFWSILMEPLQRSR